MEINIDAKRGRDFPVKCSDCDDGNLQTARSFVLIEKLVEKGKVETGEQRGLHTVCRIWLL